MRRITIGRLGITPFATALLPVEDVVISQSDLSTIDIEWSAGSAEADYDVFIEARVNGGPWLGTYVAGEYTVSDEAAQFVFDDPLSGDDVVRVHIRVIHQPSPVSPYANSNELTIVADPVPDFDADFTLLFGDDSNAAQLFYIGTGTPSSVLWEWNDGVTDWTAFTTQSTVLEPLVVASDVSMGGGLANIRLTVEPGGGTITKNSFFSIEPS